MSRLKTTPQLYFPGDRVRVRSDADRLPDLLGLGVPTGMSELLGKETTVSRVFPLGRTHIYVLDAAEGVWSADALEKVSVPQIVTARP